MFEPSQADSKMAMVDVMFSLPKRISNAES
jgi:hypothetical protein